MVYVVGFGGERLDKIAKTMLQTEQQGAVTALLNANPGLAAIAGAGFVPAGTKIAPPASFEPAPTTSFTLAWE